MQFPSGKVYIESLLQTCEKRPIRMGCFAAKNVPTQHRPALHIRKRFRRYNFIISQLSALIIFHMCHMFLSHFLNTLSTSNIGTFSFSLPSFFTGSTVCLVARVCKWTLACSNIKSSALSLEHIF